MTKIVQQMKYQIIKPVGIEWKQLGDILYELSYQSRQIANKSMTLFWESNSKKMNHHKIYGEYPDLDVIYPNATQKTMDGYIYSLLTKEYPDMAAINLSAIVQQTKKRWSTDVKEILQGKKSIASFKQGYPIHLHNRSVKIIKQNDGDYVAQVSLFSNTYKKANNLATNTVLVKLATKKQKSMKLILDRVINGQYNLGACMLKKDKRNNWYLHIVYKFEQQQHHDFIPGLTMGIDIGVVNPIYFAFNVGYQRGRIEGGEIESFRQRVEQQRISKLRQGSYSNRSGKGRGKILEPTNVLEDKITKFRNATNHKYANYVVQQALDNKCGIIQMEDLSGISTDNRFLQNWTYFDLQTKIKHHAAVEGIKVIKIDPKYTSQRCSKCGVIDKDSRLDQSTFSCTNCDFKTNADYNAARNIATPDIDKIIKKQAKLQKI